MPAESAKETTPLIVNTAATAPPSSSSPAPMSYQSVPAGSADNTPVPGPSRGEGSLVHRGFKSPASSRPTSPIPEESYARHADVIANDTSIPKSVFFIIGNEFCERFTFYGIKAILYIYLTRYMLISSDSSTALVHGFNMLAYLFTLVGGLLSDSYLGRFRTIVYLSLVYCIGNAVLSVTAIPGVIPANPAPAPWGMATGLLLLAFGTGGIKPCVSAFGGDQFHPSQARAISLFFSLFYFAINSGSLLSMFLTPLLRSTSCFGRQDCFSLAFGLPSLLMLVSTMIFIAGKRHYKQQPPSGNVLGKVLAAVSASRKMKAQNPDVTMSHWLDYASLDERFDTSFIKDIKQLFSVLWVFLPLPVFWTLYDQQGSRWTSQALLMKSKLSLFGFEFEIKPDQMQVTNAILILAFIPLSQRFVYPYIKWLSRPLRRITSGMILLGCAFALAAVVQFWIEQGHFVTFRGDKWVEVTDPAERRSLSEQGALKCIDRCVPIVWQVPQYIILTAGEILFSITGLEFAYSQSPASLKSVCQAAWQITVAVGNLFVIIIAESRLFEAQAELIFFAGCIFLATMVFAFMARGFNDRQPAQDGEGYQPIEDEVI